MVLGVMAIVIATSGNVYATEGAVPFSTVVVKANVPEDFTEIIGFTLKAEDEERGTTVTLTKEKGYVEEMMCIMGGKVYETQYAFNNMEDYRVDLAEKYEINGLNVELTFNVTKIEYSIENPDAPATVTTLTPVASTAMPVEDVDDSEYDELTGLKKATVVLEDFKQATSFMETDPNFERYLNKFNNEVYKNAYLDVDPMNTAEQWEAKSIYEKFTYYMCYVLEYNKLTYLKADRNLEEYIEYFSSHKRIITNIERGDEVYAALEEVLIWYYKYWQVTGTVGNIFAGDNIVTVEEAKQEEVVKLTDSDKEDLEEIRAALSEELETEIAMPEVFEDSEQKVALSPSIDEASSSSNNGFVIIMVTAIIVSGAVAIVAILKKKQN